MIVETGIPRVLTVGHSNHPIADFLDLLKKNGVEVVVLATSLFAQSLFSQPAFSRDGKICGETPPLERRIPELNVEGGTALSAIYSLGFQNGVCFGVEIGNPAILGAAPKLHERDLTVHSAVQMLLQNDRSYRVREDRGFVLITPSLPHDKLKWLDERIPRFKSDRMPVKYVAEFQLKGALEAVRNPASGGLAGSVIGDDMTRKVGPFDEHGKSVRQLLGLILGKSARECGLRFRHLAENPTGRSFFMGTLQTEASPR